MYSYRFSFLLDEKREPLPSRTRKGLPWVGRYVTPTEEETVRVFGKDDVQIVSVMMDEIGFALENARLHSRVEENLRDSRAGRYNPSTGVSH